jgi:pilus assembly protein CpaB
VSPRSLLVVVVALVFGGSAAMGVNSFIRNPPSPKVDAVQVVVAAIDVPRGGNLTADLVRTRDIPKDLVPLGAINKVQDVIDRAVFIPLLKDEPVLEGKLAPKGSGRGLAALVPKGLRAFTIQTPNIATGVAGFVLPGNKVDVLLTVDDVSGITPVGMLATSGGGSSNASTTTLLQNVEILAVDQKTMAPAENKMDAKELRSVTLLVTPQQANELDLAQNKGKLHLALRNLDDSQDARTRPTTLSDLRFHQGNSWDQRARLLLEALGKTMAQRKPEPPAPLTIRTLRGTREGGVIIQVPETHPATAALSSQAPKG